MVGLRNEATIWTDSREPIRHPCEKSHRLERPLTSFRILCSRFACGSRCLVCRHPATDAVILRGLGAHSSSVSEVTGKPEQVRASTKSGGNGTLASKVWFVNRVAGGAGRKLIRFVDLRERQLVEDKQAFYPGNLFKPAAFRSADLAGMGGTMH